MSCAGWLGPTGQYFRLRDGDEHENFAERQPHKCTLLGDHTACLLRQGWARQSAEDAYEVRDRSRWAMVLKHVKINHPEVRELYIDSPHGNNKWSSHIVPVGAPHAARSLGVSDTTLAAYGIKEAHEPVHDLAQRGHLSWLPDDVTLPAGHPLYKMAGSGRYDISYTKKSYRKGDPHHYEFEVHPKTHPGIRSVDNPRYSDEVRREYYDPNLARVEPAPEEHAPNRVRVTLKPGLTHDFPEKRKETRTPSPFEPKPPPEPEPEHLYRGMSHEEWEDIKKTGRVKSNASMNFTGQEHTTSFSTDPESAAHYASGFAPEYHKPGFLKPAYVVKVRNPGGGTRLQGSSTHERDVEHEIPTSDIVAVYRGDVAHATAGTHTLRPPTLVEPRWSSGGASGGGSSVVWRKIDHERELKGVTERADDLIARSLTERSYADRIGDRHGSQLGLTRDKPETFGKTGGWSQQRGNCKDIACNLARAHGFDVPKEFHELWGGRMANRAGDAIPSSERKKHEASLVLRGVPGQLPAAWHVSFHHARHGEMNYGPHSGGPRGMQIVGVIPLRRTS